MKLSINTAKIGMPPWLSFLVMCLSIFLGDCLVLQAYLNCPFKDSPYKLSTFIVFQAVCAWVIGELAAKYGRKQLLLCTQICGVVLGFFTLSYSYYWLPFLLFGLTFSPGPPVRGILLNNYSAKMAQITIMTLSLIAQFAPWALAPLIPNTSFFWKFLYCVLLVVTLIQYFTLNDHKKLLSHSRKTQVYISSTSRHRVIRTLLAVGFAQIVFFIAFESTEYAKNNSLLFSGIGMGAIFAASTSFLYRKIPHMSVLTLLFGVGATILMVSVSIVFILGLSLDLAIFMTVIGSLGGLYLPFVYDLILHATKSDYRTVACGRIEAIQSISSLFGTLFVNVAIIKNMQNKLLLIISLFAMLIAIIIQKSGEKYHEHYKKRD